MDLTEFIIAIIAGVIGGIITRFLVSFFNDDLKIEGVSDFILSIIIGGLIGAGVIFSVVYFIRNNSNDSVQSTQNWPAISSTNLETMRAKNIRLAKEELARRNKIKEQDSLKFYGQNFGNKSDTLYSSLFDQTFMRTTLYIERAIRICRRKSDGEIFAKMPDFFDNIRTPSGNIWSYESYKFEEYGIEKLDESSYLMSFVAEGHHPYTNEKITIYGKDDFHANDIDEYTHMIFEISLNLNN